MMKPSKIKPLMCRLFTYNCLANVFNETNYNFWPCMKIHIALVKHLCSEILQLHSYLWPPGFLLPPALKPALDCAECWKCNNTQHPVQSYLQNHDRFTWHNVSDWLECYEWLAGAAEGKTEGERLYRFDPTWSILFITPTLHLNWE